MEERFRLDATQNVVKNGKEKEEKEGAKGSSCQFDVELNVAFERNYITINLSEMT